MQTGRESDVPAGVISNCRAYQTKLHADVGVVFDCWHGEQAKLLLVSD